MGEPQLWKQIFNSQLHAPPSSNISWEEKAFAEDTSGSSIWPPRSYSCNFCMRQFRSAQALGGHMNVHRRDRARLQHALLTSNNTTITSKIISNPSIFTSTIEKKNPEENSVSGLYVETELSMSSFLNLQNRPSGFCGNEALLRLSSKRPKISISSPDDLYSSGSTEELDLELRLGA